MNPFAAKQSGMASFMEQMIPPDVMDAIRIAKERLPEVIEQVQQAVRRIEHKLDTIDVNVQLINNRINMLNSDYVPENEQLAQLPQQVNGEDKHE